MKEKIVKIYKTTAVGPTCLMCTSGRRDFLSPDASDRRFFAVEGHRTGKVLTKNNPGDVVVVPPNG